jgi:mannose/fructose/N-acetylgalactosamine-specific phosphotransferase system component IIC
MMTTATILGAAGLAIAVLLGMLVMIARMAGKATAEKASAVAKSAQAQKANRIDETVNAMSDRALDDELRGRG